MSVTSIMDRPSTDNDIVDIGDVAPPRCPRTRRSMRDHDESAGRHQEHQHIKGCKELARRRRGKSQLSETQNRMLFDNTLDPQDVLDAIAGHKLTKRQVAQVKVLKKLRAGKPIRSLRTSKTKEQGRRRTKSQQAHNRVPKHLGRIDDTLDLTTAKILILGDDVIFSFEGFAYIPAA